MSKRINNHLREGYSNFNLMFIKKHYKELSLKDKIIDVGAGHFRNLKLFQELGFKNLSAIDKNIPEPKFDIKVNFILQDIQKGLPYIDKEFEVVLCNFVLMFIDADKQKFVVQELLRVSKKFLIIETYKLSKNTKETEYKEYDFENICEWIKENKEFEILEKKKYYQKLLVRRIENG